jgi:Zn-dependent M28 family amino/carboxypeptidase
VPVLADKGRYLVVDLEPERAAALGARAEPCYTVAPLPRDTVVLDTHPAAARARAPLPWVQALVDSISRASFEEDLRALAAFRTRLSTSAEFIAAVTAAKSRLTAMGYSVRTQPITVQDAPSTNLIAERRGVGPAPRKVVLVTAHLDSINIAGGAAAPAPGADDNGSGSAGLLAIARALKDHRGVHDLRLILFGGEEQGLHGSRQYVAGLSAVQRQRLSAVVNMDMIATLNMPEPTVLLEGAPVSQAVIDGLAASAATYTTLAVETSLSAANSDHVPFIRRNLPAVLTIEGSDSANTHIHSANDTLTHVNAELALDILRMNVAFVAQALGKA